MLLATRAQRVRDETADSDSPTENHRASAADRPGRCAQARELDSRSEALRTVPEASRDFEWEGDFPVMYARSQTWLPTQPRGLGAISMSDLAMAARRSRGMGQTAVSAPATGIAPGSPCYDPSHDNGENHCASISQVLWPGNWFGNGMTTTCSVAEQACLQGGASPTVGGLTANQQAVTAAASSTGDICSQNIGLSCTTVVLIVVAALITVPLITAARRY